MLQIFCVPTEEGKDSENDSHDVAPRQAKSAPPKQTRPVPVEQLRAEVLDDIKRTCNLLNSAGDTYEGKNWTGGTMKKFIEKEFETEGGLDALSPEYLKQLLGKLNLRLDRVNNVATMR
jgi:hypothetical protein